MHYDVFNGDADGIMSLIQLRKAQPRSSTLITGVKRDIQLLKQVVAQEDASGVTVLDISMEKNIDALYELIENRVPVFYCDHHRTGEVPQSDALTALINLDANVCTSWLVNRHVGEQYVDWAIAGIFGDNLFSTAQSLAAEHGLEQEYMEFLKELGTLVNYNGYGATLEDLHIQPKRLFQQLIAYASPRELLEDPVSPYFQLQNAYLEDNENVATLRPVHSCEIAEVYVLPCEAWARRIGGVFGNALANQTPNKAHAVVTLNANQEDYTVSVRAPMNNRTGADEICIQFPTGGGRKAAAGINQVPKYELASFIQTLTDHYAK